MKNYFLMFMGVALLAAVTGCVPKRQLLASQLQTRQLQNDSASLANQVSDLQNKIAGLQNDISNLNGQVANLSRANGDKQNQLNSSQQTLAEQQARLQHLQALLDAQKQKSEEIRKKMADALSGFSSSELTVTQKNGKVYVSLQENLLFASGSAVVSQKGVDALSKLAAVLNLNPDIQIDVEGHTDSIPIKMKFQDNWELSTARANSIVRILVYQYKVNPMSVIASGHSQYDPVSTNSTPDGRAQNRRTDIILSPKLDELYKLISE
ncbi:MAG TPA: flagellar motor protein MotB [Arachidicoccus sp.]